MREKKLLPGSSCVYPRSLVVLHCTRSSLHLVSFHKPLGSMFFLSQRFFPLVPCVTLRGQPMSVQISPAVSPYNTTFAVPLFEKCHFVPLRVSWPNFLLGNEGLCWMSLLYALFLQSIDLTLINYMSSIPLLKSISAKRNIIISIRAIILRNPTYLLGRWPYGFIQQHPLNMFRPFPSNLRYCRRYLPHLSYIYSFIMILLWLLFHFHSLPCRPPMMTS